MKKYIVVAAAVLLLFALDTRSVAACSCALPATAHDALQQVDVVFSGKVQSFIQVQEFNEDAGGLVVLSVDQTWKGTASAVVLLNSGYNAMSCEGYFWEQGQEYLVYAHRRANGTLGIHLCSRTSDIQSAQQDLRALGVGAPPSAASTVWPYVGVLALVVLVGIATRWLVRRRTRT